MSQQARTRLLVASAALAVVAALIAAVWAPAARQRAAPASGSATGPASGDVGGAPAPAVADITYTVTSGDTLSGVAAKFGVSMSDLAALNGLTDVDELQIGQKLAIRSIPTGDGPATRVIPDSELVYGPAYVGFDARAESARWGGYLANYSEQVNGELLTGPDIVATIARDFSVGPRVLLAIIEARSGWVTGEPADANAAAYPAGMADPARTGLWRQLNWLADRLNGGYYDWKTRDNHVLTLSDGTRLAGLPDLGPGAFAVQRALAFQATPTELPTLLDAVAAAYQKLYGDPFALERPALDLAHTTFPTLTLPFPHNERWWFTGGPHGGWADGSAWAALDFVPDEDQFGCFTSAHWSIAAADGVILPGGAGQVWLDLDGDGQRQTGPLLLYLHQAAEGRIAPGTHVTTGTQLGHPSCEGGMSNATHLHLARLYDGEWLAAGGAVPFNLGGWRATAGHQTYDGSLTQPDGRKRTACECRTVGTNDVGNGS